MNFTTVLLDPYFLAYTITAIVLLAASWGGLVLRSRRGQRLEQHEQLFWSWVALVAVSSGAILLGKEVFALVVVLLCLFACKEFARATGLYDDWIFTGFVYLAILVVNLVALWPGYDGFMATPIYAVALLCLLPVVRNRSEGMLQRVALSVMAFVYFGYFLAHLSLLAAVTEEASVGRIYHQDPYGYLFFLLYGTASADLAGWLAGRWMGQHALAPRISRAMTWERAAASLAWGVLWSFALGWTLPQPQFSWVARLLAGLLFGGGGLLGDLVLRYILRDLGLQAVADKNEVLPNLALGQLHRFIFVAPLFVRLVHWFDTGLFQPLPLP